MFRLCGFMTLYSTDMDFKSLVLNRQSDRSYLDRTVEREKLEVILECARLSPSACNAQPWHIIVVDDTEIKNKIADATSNDSVVISCCWTSYRIPANSTGNYRYSSIFLNKTTT